MRYRRDKCCFRRIQLFKLRDVFQYNYVPQFFGFFTVVIRVVYFYIGLFIATPTFAWAKAGASLVPSPIMATSLPALCSFLM